MTKTELISQLQRAVNSLYDLEEFMGENKHLLRVQIWNLEDILQDAQQVEMKNE